MKKQEFIKAISSASNLSQEAGARILESIIGTITTELGKWGEINITGFWAFKISERAARNGVNPRTWESIKIPAMKSPVFRAWKTFKEAVR